METLRKRIPTGLTLLRFPLGAAFAVCHFSLMPLAGLIIVFAGCITDWFDGHLARKWNATSDFGKIADAYADKWICWIMTVVAFDILGPDAILIALSCVIFIYDAGLSYLRYTLGHREIAVSWFAKAKTTALMSGLMLLYLDWSARNPMYGIATFVAYAVLIAAGILAIMSIGRYLRGYKLEKLIPYPLYLFI